MTRGGSRPQVGAKQGTGPTGAQLENTPMNKASPLSPPAAQGGE